MKKTIKIIDGDAITRFEDFGTEAYLTVARLSDVEDDERIAILNPRQALRLARNLINFSLRASAVKAKR